MPSVQKAHAKLPIQDECISGCHALYNCLLLRVSSLPPYDCGALANYHSKHGIGGRRAVAGESGTTLLANGGKLIRSRVQSTCTVPYM
jgi:hypothetical protein